MGGGEGGGPEAGLSLVQPFDRSLVSKSNQNPRRGGREAAGGWGKSLKGAGILGGGGGGVETK